MTIPDWMFLMRRLCPLCIYTISVRAMPHNCSIIRRLALAEGKGTDRLDAASPKEVFERKFLRFMDSAF